MPTRVTTGERLKQLMRERNLKAVDIIALCKPYADRYGVEVTKTNMSQWTHGQYVPNQHKLKILSMALGVSPAWLMGFDVPMEVSDDLAAKRKADALQWIRYEATKEERLELLKELAEQL